MSDGLRELLEKMDNDSLSDVERIAQSILAERRLKASGGGPFVAEINITGPGEFWAKRVTGYDPEHYGGTAVVGDFIEPGAITTTEDTHFVCAGKPVDQIRAKTFVGYAGRRDPLYVLARARRGKTFDVQRNGFRIVGKNLLLLASSKDNIDLSRLVAAHPRIARRVDRPHGPDWAPVLAVLSELYPNPPARKERKEQQQRKEVKHASRR